MSTRKKKKENEYQPHIIETILTRLPNAMITKLDCNHTQGIPDLLILNGDRWATLEVKQNATADHQPNQDYYVDQMNSMSFSSFIYPENEEEVLHGLYKALEP